jgi:hypothetical protein
LQDSVDKGNRHHRLQNKCIHDIPVEYFLKWAQDLGLSQAFIQACKELQKYYRYANMEARKEPQLVD